MKKIILLTIIVLLSSSTWADNIEPLLNKVILQLRAEQWLTTKTALVTVAVNAAVADQGIEKIQSDVIQKLNRIAVSDWHVISLDRQQDRSGLESVQISAQARLAQTDLSGLRDKAKNISKAGETFTIENVAFTPSESEIQQANLALRENIYQQTKAEIDALNKAYPDQKYYLHQINFQMHLPMPMANTMVMAKMNGERQVSAAPLDVGNKQEMQATVTLASTPEFMQKLAHS